ncbi:MAG: NAD-dependent 4,6-dehydratase LegB [Bacteroidia bacterium]
MKQVLLTGAGGFIGSHLAEVLVQQGHRVRALLRYNAGQRCGWLDTLPPPLRREIEVVFGDVRDPDRMNDACQGVEQVFHLAALIAIPYSYHAPESYLDTNLRGTLNLLRAARQQGVAQVLLTSSSEVYGTARYVPMDEVHPLEAQSPYAASKTAADQLGLAWYHSFGLPVRIVRPFNTYGPRQSLRAVIPSIIVQLLRGADELHLGSLTPTRDFNYVGDTARAFAAIAEAPGLDGQVVQVATGQEVAIGDLAARLVARLRPHARIASVPARVRPDTSEVYRLCGSPARLHAGTSFRAAYDLDSGIEACIDWFSRPENLAYYPPDAYAL